jgi:hypothetical protein
MHRPEKIVFEEEQNPEDPFDENEVLKDGRSFRVEASMQDGMTADMREAVIRQMQPKDSKAFPRTGRMQVVDGSTKGTLGLHHPGFRVFSQSGTPGDQWLADGLHEEAQLAYAAVEHRLTNAWKGRDTKHRDDDDDEVEARCAAIRNALTKRGHDPEDIAGFVNDLDDDDLFDNSIGEHVAAFEADNGGRSTDAATLARHHKAKMDELYRKRDAELANQWRKNK